MGPDGYENTFARAAAEEIRTALSVGVTPLFGDPMSNANETADLSASFPGLGIGPLQDHSAVIVVVRTAPQREGSTIHHSAWSWTVTDAVAGFLADAAARTKPSTHDLYKRHLRALAGELGEHRVAGLTVPTLARWLQGLGVGSTTQAITLRSVSAFLGWCVRQGIAPKNPAQAMAKPRSRSRGEEAVISAEDHDKLLALATPQFRLVLTVLHATGARPGEVCRITAENFDPVSGVVKLSEHKSDRTGRPRLIFLPPDVAAMLKVQAGRYGSGLLLRNRLDKPWTPKAIAWALLKLREKAGVKAIAYGYRHGYATEALAKGLPDAQVAALLGHSSTAMLHKHYAHLTAQAGVLRNAAALVRPAATPDGANSGGADEHHRVEFLAVRRWRRNGKNTRRGPGGGSGYQESSR